MQIRPMPGSLGSGLVHSLFFNLKIEGVVPHLSISFLIGLASIESWPELNNWGSSKTLDPPYSITNRMGTLNNTRSCCNNSSGMCMCMCMQGNNSSSYSNKGMYIQDKTRGSYSSNKGMYMMDKSSSYYDILHVDDHVQIPLPPAFPISERSKAI